MANQEHLDILKRGVEVWNTWRKQHPEIRPDLSSISLNNTSLSGADFRSTFLQSTDLKHTDLHGADLIGANLMGVDLSFASLSGVKLTGANLHGADLSGADLSFADFSGADLSYANLSRTTTIWTIFGNVDLRTVTGLDTIEHKGPSTIGIDTIMRSEGAIPERFLHDAGVSDNIITYIHSLVNHPINYYTCFISYSSKDQEFAERLYADLQSNNVRCWFAPHDLRPGTVILRGIDDAIRLHDKLLLILSERSVTSNWVEHEVEMALYKEMDRKQEVLFPIRLDNTILKSPTGWAACLRLRHISDFTHWKNHDDYQQAFTRLLRHLKAETITSS